MSQRTLIELLDALRQRDIRLWLDDSADDSDVAASGPGALRFKAPKGAFSAELKAEVKARKPEIIDFLHQAQRAPSQVPAIDRAPRDQPLPLSFSQERLWFFDRFEPESALYNLLNAVHMRGALDVDALTLALGDLVERHEALRTVFVSPRTDGPASDDANTDELPHQRVLERVEVPLVIEDLGSEDFSIESLKGSVEDARQRATALAAEPFNLAAGPLLRATLLRLASQHHVLVLVMHHIVSDGWSTGVLIRDLASLYRAHRDGVKAALPRLDIHYPDYSVWQRQRLQGDMLEHELDFWRQQLEGAPEALELPLDRPRPATQTTKGRTLRFRLEPELTARLQALAQARGASLFMVLLAAYDGLLSRLSGQADVVVGSPIANRNHPRTQELIGFFVNTLALRTSLHDDPSFAEIIDRVREVTLGAYAHQDLPFEKLVEELRPERDTSRSAIFQTMMVLQNAPQPGLDVGDLRLEPLLIEGDSAQFDLTLSWVENDGGLDGDLEWNTDLFDAATVERWQGSLRRILEAVAADPDLRLSRWPLMSTSERRAIEHDWARGDALSPAKDSKSHGIHELIDGADPGTLALTDDLGGRMTYGELIASGHRLAHRLFDLHGSSESRVAVCLPRSLDWIPALLGVLRAGMVFVPLDPKAPAARQRLILHDAAPVAIITTAELAPQLALGPAAGEATATQPRILLVDELSEPDELDAEIAATSELPTVDERQLAYVIYTSGSTGKPKGVEVPHGALTRHVRGLIQDWQLGPLDRILETASFSFDVGLEQTMAALTSGASLHVRGEELYPPSELSARLDALGITVADLPMVYWQQWVAEALEAEALEAESSGSPCPQNLRILSVGGEAMSASTARQWSKTPMAHAQLINAYGPTEAAVTAVSYRVPADFDRSSVPIGVPLPARSVRVVDARGQLTAIGVVGELCLGDAEGGAMLARGYGGRPALVAERFVPDPWSQVPGARLYRSGDQARFLADGSLEFVGRVDEQVKIRGFRIELGDIESALAEHPDLGELAVLVDSGSGRNSGRNSGQGAGKNVVSGKRLVAYVTGRADAVVPPSAELRDFLSGRLPEYMVPTAFVALDALPLNTSGKLDKRALPDPVFEATAGAAPRNATEARLADIWSATLGVELEALSIDSSFFELGGHSLLATQLVTRMGRAFDVELPLKRLFESPTIRGLAPVVDTLKAEGGGTRRPPLTRADRAQPLPLSYSQERLWLFEQLVPGTSIYNTSRAGRLLGPLDVDALERALNEVVRRHESLRTRYVAVSGDDPVQIIEPSAPTALDIVDLSHLPAAERTAEAMRLAHEESETPFDLTRPDGLRCRLLRLDAREHVVLMSIHHIAYDLASGGILLHELETLYRAFATGEPSPLADLALHYGDFAAWQRSWLSDEALDDQLDYWRRQLAPMADPADTPRIEFADHPQANDDAFAGALYRFHIGGDLAERARLMSQQHNVTQFMLHLSAFMGLLYRYAPQPHLLVGTAISNRSGAEMEDVIGFFDNLLPLVARWHDSMTFVEALDEVRGVALGAYANQHVPFERLMREVRPERESRRVPMLQVIFLFLLDYPAMTRDIAGLDMVPYELGVESAKFDLTLALRDSPDGLVGQIEYNTGMFEAATIERLATHYETLLRAALDAPDRPLVELPLLSAEESTQLAEWSASPALRRPSLSAGLSVPERVARLAVEASTQSNIAVAHGDRELSYGELHRRASVLAAQLRSVDIGVGAEDRVAVCMERSVGCLTSLYGVWLAGAAYVPVDPAYPEDRVRFMLDDASAKVALYDDSTAELVTNAATGLGCTRWRVDADGRLCDGPEIQGAVDLSSPHATLLAYVIYTSGSTGTPKGVAIAHDSLARLVDWHVDAFELRASDRTGHVAGQGFDASVWEIWPTLSVGGRLELVDDAVRSDAEATRDWLVDRQIDVTFLPTPLAEAVLELPWPESPGSESRLRALLTGGDRLRLRPKASTPFELINNYGPTESTVVATSGAVTADQSNDGAPDIGFGIHGVETHVLDRSMRPLPVGCPGELYLGGEQLARGYVGQPAQSAERFVPDVIGSRPGGRLYRTGDVVRRRADGRLEFLGRRDEQVKIRGFRVELGEIETALSHLDGVDDVAVVAPTLGGGRQLVAWVVSESLDESGPENHTLEELRAQLAHSLPDYMVPARCYWLDALPLTRNGKIDRRALERLAVERYRHDGVDAVAPRTATETAMADLWAELLECPQPSIHDDFFVLGGHSLLATRLISRLRDDFGVELPLETVFDHATIAALSAAVDAAAVDIAAASQAGAGVSTEASFEIEPVDRSSPLPLSFAQERIWFLDQLRPGDPAYNIPAAVHLQGPLDAEALESAARDLVERHETLRTVFVAAPEASDLAAHAVVLPMPDAAVDFELIDRTECSLTPDHPDMLESVAEVVAQNFDLARGPLLRLRLWCLGDHSHVFVWVVHHIVADGWSMGIFLRELATFYARHVDSSVPQLQPLPVDYVDFAAAQRRWLSDGEAERQLEYWRARLDGLKPLELPTPKPPSSDVAGAIHRQVIDAEQTRSIMAFARAETASLFMVLAAALAGLLNRYDRGDRLALGYPAAGRRRGELEGLIGMFLNTLVLELEVGDSPSMAELVARARAAVLEGDAHQDVPFERVLDAVQPERDMRSTPLFQVMLNMLSFPDPPGRLGELSLEPMTLGEDTAKFDLTLYASVDSDRLRLDWVYRTARFDAQRMELMADQLATLMAAAVAEPSVAIRRLPLQASVASAGSVAASGLRAETQPSALATILLQAAAHPLRLALRQTSSSGQCMWTYRQLERRSLDLAQRLSVVGVGRGDVVAIYAARDAALVVAMLGIWRAGAAFAIVDGAYPAARLVQQLAVAQPKAVVRLEAAGDLPECLLDALGEGVAVLEQSSDPESRPDVDTFSLKYAASSFVPVIPQPRDLAYIAFTSGSTGVPRAVEGEHAPLDHFVAWHIERFGFSLQDRVAMLSGLAHDPLLRDVLTPLVCGACLEVPPAAFMREPRALRDWLRKREISKAHMTPALVRLLTEGAHAIELDALRHVFTSGEKLDGGVVARLRRLAPRTDVVNFYGATETPQAMAFFEVPKIFPEDVAVPVGRGIDGVELRVLGFGDQPASPLERGEIAVRTPLLARGYRGDDAATAERFVMIDGVRAYRTGDLGRMEPDGSITVLGRLDSQVQIRGFRVEPAEIERCLGRHPAVAESVVRPLYGGAEGEVRLGAWWVPAEPSEAKALEVMQAELRAHLEGLLPDYAVPSALVAIDAIPLTPNGKVDAGALPEPSHERTSRAPASALELTLATLWCDLLAIDDVEALGVDDNFFAIGGHSLLATRLIARLHERLGVELPLAAIFEAPTLGRLAQRLESTIAGPSSIVDVPVAEERGPGASLPLSFAQERLWFLDRFQPGGTAFILAAAFELHGRLDDGALQRALDALVVRHETLRTRFFEVDGEPRAQLDEQARVIPEHSDISGDVSDLEPTTRQEEARRLLSEPRPMALDHAPLMRVRIVKLESAQHHLLLELHHIVSDGWSMARLVSELGELYSAALERRAPRLPALELQYADVAAWQRRQLSAERMGEQLDYWRERLAGLPPQLELPTDRPRPQVLGEQGGRVAMTLDSEVVSALRATATARGTTLFTALAVGLQSLLSRFSGQNDVAIGLPVAGRRFRATEPLIGLFVNTLVLRADLDSNPTFEELVDRSHRSMIEAQAHQDVPFEKLVVELQPARSLSHAPIFQVMLAFQNVPRQAVELPDLRMEWLDPGQASTPLDLSLELMEDGDGISGSWTFNAQLFEASTVERMIKAYESILRVMAEDPRCRHLDVPLLHAGDIEADAARSTGRQLVCEQRALGADVFEIAERHPDRRALRCGDTTWTYGELSRRAENVSKELRRRGLSPEQLVGVCMHRGPEMVAALLGVLHAGGAYLPLDPSYPADRLGFMLDDACGSGSGAKRWVLGRSADRGVLPVLDADFIEVEALEVSSEPSEPFAAVDGEQLAYVIYTSGSTGQPKGVQISHRAATGFLASMAEEPGLGEEDVLAAVTTLSFDISVLEIFLPLARGATVVVADRDTVIDGAALARLLDDEQVSVLQATPAGWRMLLEAGWQGSPNLKALCGGEALTPDLAADLLSRCGELWNLYGPTETTVWSSARRVEIDERPIRLGGPIANTSLHILDAGLRPVPLGVAGEVYLGGRGVARGYRHRPALTAERFVPDPFADAPGARLYRVGDVARRRADGSLEFLGRTDHQVKVRGYRIELGEIEAALGADPSVARSVVVTRDDQLVAYVVWAEGDASSQGPGFDALRAGLRERLPTHMIPHRWVALEALPLTPSGKVDRRVLPDPSTEPKAEGEPPRNDVERQLAQLWQDVLEVENVSRDDGFFQLGGHSLLAMRLVSAISRHFGREIPVQALFHRPRLADLAELLAEPESKPTSSVIGDHVMPLNRPMGQAADPIFCIHAIGGGVTSYGELARRLERPVYGVQASEQSFDGLEDMATAYRREIRKIQPAGALSLLGWSMGGVVAFEMARQEAVAGTPVAQLIMIDSSVPDAQVEPLEERDVLLSFAADLGPTLGIAPEQLPASMAAPEPEQLFRDLEASGFLPDSISAKELEGLYVDYRRRFVEFWALLTRYQPQELQGSIELFTAQDRERGADLGWRRHVGSLDVRTLPGGHYDMLRGEAVEALVEVMSGRVGVASRVEGGERPYACRLRPPASTASRWQNSG